jgi:predicted AAA+ superfamily ATPase
MDLLTWRELDAARPAILFWRTANGEEVDFVNERSGKLLGIEAKATTNPGYNDSEGLRAFLQEYGGDVVGGILLHGGEETFWISERVLAAPWWKVI